MRSYGEEEIIGVEQEMQAGKMRGPLTGGLCFVADDLILPTTYSLLVSCHPGFRCAGL